MTPLLDSLGLHKFTKSSLSVLVMRLKAQDMSHFGATLPRNCTATGVEHKGGHGDCNYVWWVKCMRITVKILDNFLTRDMIESRDTHVALGFMKNQSVENIR